MSFPTPPLCLVMVGLPARGKTFIAQRVARYLEWLGYRARVFNVGTYRRQIIGANLPAAFFDADNPDGNLRRQEVAETALADLIAWLTGGGQVAVYDATNSTRARRDSVRHQLAEAGIDVLFVESICDDSAIVEANIRQTKLSSPDYVGWDPAEAVRDFRERIAFYEEAYEPVYEEDASWVKIVDVGRRVETNRLRGYVPGRIVFFLMNLHIGRRPLYLTRHGESLFNAVERIGGDEPLTNRGRAYARLLGEEVRRRVPGGAPVWTSTLRRTIETASTAGLDHLPLKALDEIDAGTMDGMTYGEIDLAFPEDFAARKADKLHYRYPQGESYMDVFERLDGVIIELERARTPVVVIGHQAVLRVILGWFVGHDLERVPHLHVPLHTLLEIVPRAYGCDVNAIHLDPDDAPGV